MGRLLTRDKKHVEILTQVKIDKSLPKYHIIDEESKGVKDMPMSNNNFNVSPDNARLIKKNDALTYDNLKKFMNDKSGDITDFNLEVTSAINRIIEITTMQGEKIGFTIKNLNKKETLWSTIVSYFKKNNERKNEEKKEKKFDVIKFFSEVHGLVEDEEAEKYINRIAEYIECIGYTEKTGQTALKEKLIKSLVVNKLESILYAKGMYKAIDENTIVKLAQNAPKPLSLDYVENYVRNIPIDVIKKKIEVDKLQVFDNYCILYYDENGKSYAMTDKEKAKEIQKRKDPILFGMISGSNKLYFVADWVDELCDLTFEKMTEIVGKEIVEKGFLTEKTN